MQVMINGQLFEAVVLADTSGTVVNPGGGGGSGGDTSNIKTNGTTAPTTAAMMGVKSGANIVYLSLGSAADAASLPTSRSTEDKAAIGATNEAAAASDTATSGLNGLMKRLCQRITTLIGSVLSVAPSAPVTTTESSLALSAGVSATVAASNANRLFLTIDNPGASDIWINTQGAAVATAGSSMRIFGNTQVTYSVQEIGTNAITAISTPGTTIRFRETSKT